jgi:hypothetical protein
MTYFASKYDRRACALKPKCCPNVPVRKIARPVHEAARDKARAINVTLPLGMLRHLQTTCRYYDNAFSISFCDTGSGSRVNEILQGARLSGWRATLHTAGGPHDKIRLQDDPPRAHVSLAGHSFEKQLSPEAPEGLCGLIDDSQKRRQDGKVLNVIEAHEGHVPRNR